MWDENHFFVRQELSGDDLDFTGGGNHPINAGLRERIKLLVLPCILGIGYFDAIGKVYAEISKLMHQY